MKIPRRQTFVIAEYRDVRSFLIPPAEERPSYFSEMSTPIALTT
jgi:hypothetical protein